LVHGLDASLSPLLARGFCLKAGVVVPAGRRAQRRWRRWFVLVIQGTVASSKYVERMTGRHERAAADLANQSLFARGNGRLGTIECRHSVGGIGSVLIGNARVVP
jgi:hypothetical protein